MHVSSITSTPAVDPNPNWGNWVLQFLIIAFLLALGFLYLLRSTASKYFVVDDANFQSSSSNSTLSGMANSNSNSNSAAADGACASCGSPSTKHCARCKRVKYCSQTCQSQHWKSEHKTKCMKLQSSGKSRQSMSIALVPLSGPNKPHKVVDKVLFPYDEFVKLYDWNKSIFPPCGLLNCGNSCFANVVLQCLAHTQPLVAYLLEKGHRRNCRRDGWCFLCELEVHMTRASRSQQPFSPINILSRLPSIGGNLGYGKQEDAHEFMRFAIDTMQSVCLDEHGGEKVIDPKSQETTLIQHIFGGRLRSQVSCTECNQVSNQYENMMDLTVEIQGDATSLQECLDQFTAKEWLQGENMYKCDGCKAYVRAWKRLTIDQAPNVLTIALKRFQSGRFGKINKKIIFPEYLDLSPYMSEERDDTEKYKLYAVVVHVDMLNASFFGHYICYTQGFQGDWYRIDDCKVMRVELDEVLSQGAYMLLYRRVSARPKCLKTSEPVINQQQNKEIKHTEAEHSSSIRLADSSSANLASDVNRELEHLHTVATHLDDSHSVNPVSGLPVSVEALGDGIGLSNTPTEISGEVPGVLGSPTLVANAFSDSREVSAAAVGVSDKAVNIPVIEISTGSTAKLEEHNSEESHHSYVARAAESGAATTTYQIAPCEATIPVIGTPGSTGNLEEHTSEVSQLAHDAESFAATTIDQTAPCERNDGEMGYLGLAKEVSEVYSDEMEVESVELNEFDNRSNGIIDDMIIDEPGSKTCLDKQPEKEESSLRG